MESCSVCTNESLKNNKIWQDLVEKTLVYGARRYKPKFFRRYESFCGRYVCKVCTLAYKVLLRSTFEFRNCFTNIKFKKCDSNIIMQIVKEAPQLHTISHHCMGNLFSNALTTKNKTLLNFILSLKEYNIFEDFFDAVSLRSIPDYFFLRIALNHPRFNKIMEDKDLQNYMMYSSINMRSKIRIKRVLLFYPRQTYKERGKPLWVDACMYGPMYCLCGHEIFDIWKMFFYYDINPCLRTYTGTCVMDLVVRYQSYNRLIFLLYYNIPISRSVIFYELHRLYTFYSQSCNAILCISYLLTYSDFWATIINYFHSKRNGLNKVKLKCMQPIIDFFDHHKNVPISLQKLSVIAIRKNLKIGPLKYTLKSLHYPAALKNKISLNTECAEIRKIGDVISKSKTWQRYPWFEPPSFQL